MTALRRVVTFLIFTALFTPFSHAQLVRQWVARFNGGLKNSSNSATAMTIDASGNVLVAGWGTRKGTGIDYATVKYSPDGEKLWEAWYSGPASSKRADKAVAVAVDVRRNVYVTGASDGGASGLDFATVKYDSAGNFKWATRYNGPGNGEDQPSALAADTEGVYVTGWSKGSGSGLDYYTAKYDTNGALIWEARYNGPGNGTDSALAMALRGTTDLYVTGTSVDTGYDYATVKYGALLGDQHWVARYNGPGDGNDVARAIVLRSSTEVYVTGGSQDSVGGAPADYDFATIKYDSAGTVQWVSRYNGTAFADDQATAIAVNGSGSSGRIYVAGRSLNLGSFNDLVTVSLRQSNGTIDWTGIYNGPANDNDGAVAVGTGGSPSALGPSAGIGTGQDYALVTFRGNGNNAGDVDAVERYNGPGNADDIPSAFRSSGGGTYVTGSSKATDKGSDILTIKYVDRGNMKYRTMTQDSLGLKGVNLKSPTSVPNSGNVRDEGFAKAYPKIKKGFAGYPGGLVLGNPRPDSALSYGWIRIDKGKAIPNFAPHTGNSRGFDTTTDGKPFVGEKKDPKISKYNNHLVGELMALRVSIGASDAEVTPPTLGDLTYDDGDTSNHFNGLTLRQLASVIDNNLTYWRKYPPVNWALFDSMLSRVNRSFTGPIKVVSKLPLVVTGAVLIDSITFLQPAALPVAQPLNFERGSIVEEVPATYQLEQNFPNPFNPVTTIQFGLSEAARVTLKVYDLLGREVATLVDDDQLDEGQHEVEFDASSFASGVYFYRIVVNDGEFQKIRKMVLLK